jgi:hypothetical protein
MNVLHTSNDDNFIINVSTSDDDQTLITQLIII